MKKAVFLFTTILCFITQESFSIDKKRPSVTKAVAITDISKMIINTDVIVVLRNQHSGNITLEGPQDLLDQLDVEQRGETVLIAAPKKANLKNKVVVYVPAPGLRSIEINSSAKLVSHWIIENPSLSIVVNGSCHVNIKSTGFVNVVENDRYQMEYYVNKIQLVSVVGNDR
jgi:hypothetical protein